MKWLRLIQLRRVLRKAWFPRVTFNVSMWGFVINMIDTDPVIKLLKFGTERCHEISKLAYEITDEIVKHVGYSISDESLNKLKHGVSMDDADRISMEETHALRKCILAYENVYHTNIRDWYIEYIMTCGDKYI